MKQFIEDGCHGMLFTGDKGEIVFPVKLDTNEKWLSGTLVIYGDGRVNLYPVFKNINRNTN